MTLASVYLLPGTDLVLFTSSSTSAFYLYNWKKKKILEDIIDTSSFPNFFLRVGNDLFVGDQGGHLTVFDVLTLKQKGEEQ